MKTVNGSGGYGMLIGPVATNAERDLFRRQIEAEPREFIAQPTLALSRMPIYTRRAAPGARRPAPLRALEPHHERRAGRPDPRCAARGLARRQLLAGRREQGHLGAALLMLSRVAESLYWTGRCIERAEDTSRLLQVNFHGLLDADLPDRGSTWRDLVLTIGLDDVYREHFDDYSAQAVTEFMLWHPANPDAVTACVARARENARGVREQISSEMWEHLNRLHLLVSRTRPTAVLASPHEFFVRIREGSHAFQGVMKATLPRGEAYEFIELGTHLERADATARLLAIKLPGLMEDEPATVTNERLSSLLRSCGAFEAYRKQESDELRPAQVVAYLLLERRLPRAVCFCLELALAAIRAISGAALRPEMAIGRVFSELAFTELHTLDASTQLLLERLMRGLVDAADEIAAGYFTTRVIPPGPYAQQMQQQ